MSRPSVEELKDLQRTHVLTDAHVLYVDERGFVIAHTDAERDRLDDLEECRLHQFLFNEGPPDVELPGPYVVRVHEPDDYSESYRSDPYTWEPLR